MIHVATVHFRSSRWIDVQLDYLRRHIHEPYRVVANLEAVPAGHADRFDQVVSARGGHPGKLNLLASVIVAEARPDDLIMFLDGDAFPVADPMPAARAALEDTVLFAVRRQENDGDQQPHPCFSVIRARDWDRLRGDWSAGYCWTNERGETISDVGGNLLGILDRAKEPWTPVLRSNRIDLHPLWFALYGGIVYHHGAGFRDPMARSTLARRQGRADGNQRYRVLRSGLRHIDAARDKVWGYRQMTANRRLGDEIFERLVRDPKFYLEFE